MNSKQRRKEYRAMPKAGTRVNWSSKSGRPMEGVAVGPHPAHQDKWNEERGNVPSVHRMKVSLIGGAHVHPLVSGLRSV
jgi:hypothetical protein